MLTTDNPELYELAKAMRNFGWIRGLKSEEKFAKDYSLIDRRFLFAYIGYNFRPTEIQGAFGLRQLTRLDGFIRARRENALFWLDELRKFEEHLLLPETTKGGNHVWHHFPITVRPEAPFARSDMIAFLEKRGIETRPVSAGNITEQPVYKFMNARKAGSLPNARLIMRNSFEWANHAGIGENERSYIVDCIQEFLSEHT
jgi:CDP-6-deoxy-D-xylo-4-hexulose-3-dehydrase